MKCRECGTKLKCMVSLGADETSSGYTEELWHCEHCGNDYETQAKDYWFFGWRKKYIDIKHKFWE